MVLVYEMKKNNIFWIMNLFVMIFVMCLPVSLSLSIESTTPKMFITFDKIREINVEVKKILIEEDGILPASPIIENEQVLITLTKLKNHPGEEEFQQFIDYTIGSEVTVKLVPGEYHIKGQYILNEEVLINERTDEFCKGIGGGEKTGSSFAASGLMAGAMTVAMGLGPVGWVAAGAMGVLAVATVFMDEDDCLGPKEKVKIPEVRMDSAILGGVEGNITLSDDIYSKEKLTFYTFAMSPPKIIEDMAFLSLIKNITTQNIYRIQPR